LKHNNSYDYTFVFTLAKYTGETSINHLTNWQNAVNSSKEEGLKIRPIYLSLDYMEHFGMKEEELPTFEINL